jgi:hypothetical protein
MLVSAGTEDGWLAVSVAVAAPLPEVAAGAVIVLLVPPEAATSVIVWLVAPTASEPVAPVAPVVGDGDGPGGWLPPPPPPPHAASTAVIASKAANFRNIAIPVRSRGALPRLNYVEEGNALASSPLGTIPYFIVG